MQYQDGIPCSLVNIPKQGKAEPASPEIIFPHLGLIFAAT